MPCKIKFENYFSEKEREQIDEDFRKGKYKRPPQHGYNMIRKKFPKKLAKSLGFSRDCALYVSSDNCIVYVNEKQQVKTRELVLITMVYRAP